MLSAVLGIRSIYIKRKGEQIKREEIRTGKIEIDLNKVKEIQEFVDEGHQPWRLDPEMTLASQALDFGFNEEDIRNKRLLYYIPEKGIARYIVLHKGEEYRVTLIQPVIGKDKIWVLSEIITIRELKQKKFETDPSLPIPQAFDATYIFISSGNSYIQLVWDYYIADFYNIYRATDPRGPWERILTEYPGLAHSAMDFDYPKEAKILYYRITSVKDGKESLSSKIVEVRIQ